MKTQSKKHAAQEQLLQRRNLIKELNDRLFELSQHDDWTHSEDSSDDEDLIAEYTSMTPNSSTPTISEPVEDQTPLSLLDRRKEHDSTTNSTLRTRRNLHHSPASTTTAHTLNPQSPSPNPAPPSTAAVLEAQNTTQADLTASLVSLAAMLKSSAQSFSDDLALDTAAVSATETALGKNTDGMDAATKRMTVLRKMSEGRWWLGRMMLFGIIFALWVALLFLVFVAPKLRV